MTFSYATLAQLQAEDPGEKSTATADLARLVECGIRATEVIDHLKKFTFAPLSDSRYYPSAGDDLGAYILMLDQPLMALTAVTLADGSSLTVDTYVRAWPRSSTPKLWLQIMDSAYTFTTASTTLESVVTVTGMWGWHSDYANAWELSGDKILNTGGITATENSITVADADGISGRGFTPRFSAGNLIRIESEYLAITATDTSTQALTVVRGVNGTTAATHAKDTVIYVYYPDDAIVRACQLIAGRDYDRRGINTHEETPAASIPDEAQKILDSYQFIRMGAA